MDKSNLELFKQAISEGLANRFDSVVDSYTDEIVCSNQHKLAMRTIVYGKAEAKRTWSPRMKRIVAILVAAALLLTSCGIIFRNEIREIFEDVCDFFVAITYTKDNSDNTVIDEVYELGYLPEGYYIEKEVVAPICVQYKLKNENDDYIWFEQKLIDGTDFVVDNEDGYSHIKEIESYEVYYRYTDKNHVYVWNDGKYSIKLKSTNQLSIENISLILGGLTTK